MPRSCQRSSEATAATRLQLRESFGRLDACHARCIAVPGYDRGRIRIEARGAGGALLVMAKEQPMAGVSGTEMFDSQWRSIRRAAVVLDSPEFV